jgi:hypothetical protein
VAAYEFAAVEESAEIGRTLDLSRKWTQGVDALVKRFRRAVEGLETKTSGYIRNLAHALSAMRFQDADCAHHRSPVRQR